MFGGIPNNEINEYSKYWDAFPALKNQLFESINRDFSSSKVEDIKEVVLENDDVKSFIDKYNLSFGDFDKYIEKELIENYESVNISKEESVIADEIFNRVSQLNLLDKYKPRVNIIYDFNLTKNIVKINEKHMVSFIELLKHVKTDYVFFCDNDVIFTEEFKKYLDIYQNYDIIAQQDDLEHVLKYFVKDIYMYDNNIVVKNENKSNIYVDNPYYKNIEFAGRYNFLNTYRTQSGMIIEVMDRFLPYHIFMNVNKLKTIELYNPKFEIGYSVKDRILCDSFSTLTFNARKKEFNVLYTNFENAVKHIRSGTWYRSKAQFETRLKELNYFQ